MKRFAIALSALALCALCTPVPACTKQQLTQVKETSQQAADARETTCSYVVVFAPQYPELQPAVDKCREGAVLSEVLATAAGEQACRAAYPKSATK